MKDQASLLGEKTRQHLVEEQVPHRFGTRARLGPDANVVHSSADDEIGQAGETEKEASSWRPGEGQCDLPLSGPPVMQPVTAARLRRLCIQQSNSEDLAGHASKLSRLQIREHEPALDDHARECVAVSALAHFSVERIGGFDDTTVGVSPSSLRAS